MVVTNPGLMKYPTNVGAPAFTIPAVLSKKQERGANARNQLHTKFEELKKQYFELAQLTEDTEFVYNTTFNYSPVVGRTYHIYKGDKGLFLSMIEPSRWDMECYGSFKLTSEHTWERQSVEKKTKFVGGTGYVIGEDVPVSEQYLQTLQKDNPSWCPVPWTSFSINNNGDYRMCVQANTHRKTRGTLRTDKDVAMRADTHSVADTRNCSMLKDVRASMIAGERHEVCQRCNKEDDVGQQSRRRLDIRRFYDTFNYEDSLKVTSIDGSIDIDNTPLYEADIRFSNLCNLVCRMCNPTESTLWYKEHHNLVAPKFKSGDYRVKLTQTGSKISAGGGTVINSIGEEQKPDNWNPFNWYDNTDLWKDFKTHAPNIRLIHISGGEPLINKKQFELLENLIDQGLSQNIVLDYNTNWTNIPQKLFQYWEHFKRIDIGGSVDGIGKLDEYIRYPSKWPDIEKNIIKLDRASPDNVNPWLTFTFQIVNIFEPIEIIKWNIKNKWGKLNRLAKTPWFTQHPVHNPKYYCVTSLPKKAKLYIREEYEKWLYGWFKEWCMSLPSDYELPNSYIPAEPDTIRSWDKNPQVLFDETEYHLQSMLTFMDSEDTSDTLVDFIEHTTKLDESRGQKFKDYCPKIYEFINEWAEEHGIKF